MDIDTAKLRELAQAATPGPWEACQRGDYGDYDGDSRVICGDDIRITVVPHSGWEQNDHNAAYIAAANPATVLALLDENAKLRGLLAEASDEIAAYVKHQYAGCAGYPTMERRMKEDMDIVRRIHAALSGGAA